MKKTKAPVIINPQAESLVILDPKMDLAEIICARRENGVFCLNPFALLPTPDHPVFVALPEEAAKRYSAFTRTVYAAAIAATRTRNKGPRHA